MGCQWYCRSSAVYYWKQNSNTRCVTKCQHYYNPFMILIRMTPWFFPLGCLSYRIHLTCGERTKKAPAMTPDQLNELCRPRHLHFFEIHWWYVAPWYNSLLLHCVRCRNQVSHLYSSHTMSCWLCLWQFSGTLDQVTREALYGMLHTMCLHTKLIHIILTNYLSDLPSFPSFTYWIYVFIPLRLVVAYHGR